RSLKSLFRTPRSRPSGRPFKRPPKFSRRPELEGLEDRTLLSSIVWDNRGVTSGPNNDRFNDVFGGNANLARNVVDAVLLDWQNIITNFNYSNGTNTLHVKITMGGPGFGANASYGSGQLNGKPTYGEITIGSGSDPFGAGWFLDPTPNYSEEFRGLIIGPSVA